MKILPIFNNYQRINNNINIKKENNTQTNPTFNTQITGIPKSYISFSGGDTLDLYKTFALLYNKYERDGEEQVPFLVKQEILKELEKQNPDNKTLIDVHKQVYAKLLNANDLDEIKLLYPTFRLVKKFNDVDFKDNAFVAEIKRGDNPIFNNKEDLSVQLIKLYWGEGFSLSDIAKQANTKPSTISAVMEKLNIERVTPYYGRLLKLSDREYNERFTGEMAEKMELIAAQKRGEPYIPRKPLTKVQRQHISESLIKFYAEHPERISDMSDRQKEFFKKHPEAKLIFRFVMYKAWNMDSCEVVRRKMSEFQKRKNGFSNTNNIDMTSFNKIQSEIMKEFWAQHPYEKKKFSKAVEQAWKKISNYKDIELIKTTADVKLFPKELENEIKSWAKSQGYNITDFNPTCGLQLLPAEFLNKTKEHKILNEFFKNNKDKFKIFNDAISYQIMGIHNYYKRINNADLDFARDVVVYIDKAMYGRTKMDVNSVIKLYAEVLTMVKDSGNIEEYNKILKAYDLIYGKDFSTGIFTLFNL